jgi:thioredoxin reductase (NADPH)
VVFPDGSVLARPTARQLADKTGMATAATGARVHDLVIIGAGPAGLAAAVYGSSEGLDTVVVERWAIGGQAGTSNRIENYLGFPGGISGSDLAQRAFAQARRFNAEILTAVEATGIRLEEPTRVVMLGDGTELRARSVLIATGMTIRTIDAPGFEKLRGAGVYYGATRSEAANFKGEKVLVVGGANSAGQAALMLAQHAEKVTIVVRADSLAEKMSAYLIDQIDATANIDVLTGTEIAEAAGEEHLTEVTVVDRSNGERRVLPASGMFLFIGAVPHTDFLQGLVRLNEAGFVLAGPDLVTGGAPPPGWPLKRLPYMLETSVPGIFAAGDVKHGSIRRVAAAVGAGSASLTFVHEYLASV